MGGDALIPFRHVAIFSHPKKVGVLILGFVDKTTFTNARARFFCNRAGRTSLFRRVENILNFFVGLPKVVAPALLRLQPCP